MSHLRAVPDGPTGPRESTVPPRSGSASSVRVEAPGKVNLFLSVGAPGPDGYHPLTTVFQAVRLIETVTARRQSAQDHGTVTLTLEEPDADVPADDSNLAVRAATLLAQTTGVSEGVDLLLRKRVPVAGGMAGGSADAAAALVACNALWGTGLSLPELSALAARLGVTGVLGNQPCLAVTRLPARLGVSGAPVLGDLPCLRHPIPSGAVRGELRGLGALTARTMLPGGLRHCLRQPIPQVGVERRIGGERAAQIRSLDGDVLHRLGADRGIGRHRGRVHRGIQSLDLRSARGHPARPPKVLWNAL